MEYTREERQIILNQLIPKLGLSDKRELLKQEIYDLVEQEKELQIQLKQYKNKRERIWILCSEMKIKLEGLIK